MLPCVFLPFASTINSPMWSSGPTRLQAAADWLIWLAIIGIPLTLIWHARKQPPPVRRLLSLLAAFTGGIALALALRTLPGSEADSWDGTLIDVTVAVAAWAAVAIFLRQLPSVLRAVEREARSHDLEHLRLLKTAVSVSEDGVMIADAPADDSRPPQIVFANTAFEQMMGYSVSEALGLSPSVFCHPESSIRSVAGGRTEPVAPEEKAGVEALRAALRGEDPVRLELPGRRKDGSRLWAEWQIVPVADATGRKSHWVAILRDMTERRRLEERLRESQKMDAIGRLAGGVAHDFNNLLTVIRGNAELLREAEPGYHGIPELVEEIRGAGERAAGLIRQLLTFGRRQPARPEVVDLNAVVSGMAGMLRRLLGEPITITTRFHPSPVCSRVDRIQLEQVVMNLAVNARDAMPHGGTLTIATDVVKPADGIGNERLVRLTVADTGTGITDDVRAKIFEPFFTTKEPGRGTGLGLATVYGIVTQAGGRIGLDSTLGVGTEFRVELPQCQDCPRPSAYYPATTPAPRLRPTGHGRSVLLVEDEDGVRKLVSAALEANGYTVTEAPDGGAALELLTPDLAVDVLVTDLTMPGIGGRELAGQVRERRPELGVVFISGYAPDAGWLDGIPGAVFLSKPFTPADLLKAVNRTVSRAARLTAASP